MKKFVPAALLLLGLCALPCPAQTSPDGLAYSQIRDMAVRAYRAVHGATGTLAQAEAKASSAVQPTGSASFAGSVLAAGGYFGPEGSRLQIRTLDAAGGPMEYAQIFGAGIVSSEAPDTNGLYTSGRSFDFESGIFFRDWGNQGNFLFDSRTDETNTVTFDGVNVDFTAANVTGLRHNDYADAASAANAGALRYRVAGTASFAEMSMQTATNAYGWVVLSSNVWSAE